MKRLVIMILLVLTTGIAGARVDEELDESVPYMVKQYIALPCDALSDSYEFQYGELENLTKRLQLCHTIADPDYKYAQLMCLYVKMEWEYMYDNLKSVEKAYHLMCDETGARISPEYKIDY